LAELEEELKGKENEVSAVEELIKKNHTDISKKQLKVDRLNKEFAEVSKNSDGGENKGPLENQKKAIEQKINDLEMECLKVQKDWITNQSALIGFQGQLEEVRGLTDELNTKEMIMHKKKMRLNQQVESHNKRIRELEIAHKNLTFEMNKLNDLIYRHDSATAKLKDANFNIEIQFKQKLKALEKESIELENQITQLKEFKADTLGEIVEAERQILLWERKITLEKEM
jgi:chromosome segregation ATPase